MVTESIPRSSASVHGRAHHALAVEPSPPFVPACPPGGSRHLLTTGPRHPTGATLSLTY